MTAGSDRISDVGDGCVLYCVLYIYPVQCVASGIYECPPNLCLSVYFPGFIVGALCTAFRVCGAMLGFRAFRLYADVDCREVVCNIFFDIGCAGLKLRIMMQYT